MLGQAADVLRLQRPHRALRQAGDDGPELLGQRQERPDLLADLGGRRDVHRVGHELPTQRQADHLRDGRAGLVLGLLGGRPQVRRGHDLLEHQQWVRPWHRLRTYGRKWWFNPPWFG